MPADRYFVEGDLVPGSLSRLDEEELHHLAKVMRKQVKDRIELINGKGQLALAEVEELGKKEAVVRVHEVVTHKQLRPRIILAQAIPKATRLSPILEKGTELGIAAFWLFPAKLSERSVLPPSYAKRARSVLIAALKQSGGLYLPTFEERPAIPSWKELPSPAFYGDVNPQAPRLISLLEHLPNPETVCICIGPEAGFTEGEEQRLRELGALGASLHPYVLRTDTAPLAAAAIVAHRYYASGSGSTP